MIGEALYSSARGDWGTPGGLFVELHRRWRFTVDAAARADNALLPRWFGPGGEQPCGLAADWSGERVWCNPPYGRGIGAWLAKAAERRAEIAVLLLPARTDTRWFHDHVLGQAEIEFVRGRLRFKGAPAGAPFPSMLVIYG